MGTGASVGSVADEERWQEVGALRWAQGTDGELVEPFGLRYFGGFSERMVSLSSHLGGRFGGIGRFDKLSDRWGQGLGGVKRGRVVG